MDGIPASVSLRRRMVDPIRAALAPNDPPYAQAPVGADPRHSAFSPDGRSLYVVNEMGGSACAFAFFPERGVLSFRRTISTLPAGFHGSNVSAEIQVHPSGRFVYVANRIYDNSESSLAVFARNPKTSTLRLVEIASCGGQVPRNLGQSPDGRWLLPAIQKTAAMVVFRVDSVTDGLAPTGVNL